MISKRVHIICIKPIPLFTNDLSSVSCYLLMNQRTGLTLRWQGPDGHGLSRLRKWPEPFAEDRQKALKGFMGPFVPENVTTACAVCNLMKGSRRIRSFVEAARTIVTHRCGESMGSYPHRFRNNISKRSAMHVPNSNSSYHI